MITIEAACEVSGPEFSPERARRRTGLKIPESVEVGAPSKRPSQPRLPIGHATIRLEDEGIAPGGERPEEILLGLVERHAQALRDEGATDFEMWLFVEYEGQCNMQFSPEFLARLGKVGMHLLISCYEGNEEE